MQKEVKRFPLWIWEIAALVVVTPVVIFGGHLLLFREIVTFSLIDEMTRMPLLLSFAAILLADAGLIFLIVKAPVVGIELKILASWLVVAISGAILFYLFVYWVLEGAFA